MQNSYFCRSSYFLEADKKEKPTEIGKHILIFLN